MGKLGKAFGFAKKGNIGLSFEKATYVAGEIVNGTAFVRLHEVLQCDAVVVKVTGKECVHWHELRTRTEGDRTETYEHKCKGDHEFFKQKLVLSPMAQIMNPGDYIYPFQFKLPEDLPGSFEMDLHGGSVTKGEAKIQYKFKATVDVGGFLASDFKCKSKIAVHALVRTPIRASEDSISRTVRYLCCLDKGTCHLAVAMDKNVYFPGEMAQINCSINNQSTVGIRKMQSLLKQTIRLHASGSHQVITKTIARCDYQGVMPHSSLHQPQPLSLVNICAPSVRGRHVTCEYCIEIVCDLPMCPDVELHLPVEVLAPPIPVTWWVPSQAQAAVQPRQVNVQMQGAPPGNYPPM